MPRNYSGLFSFETSFGVRYSALAQSSSELLTASGGERKKVSELFS
jgi:hypothetical protein